MSIAKSIVFTFHINRHKLDVQQAQSKALDIYQI